MRRSSKTIKLLSKRRTQYLEDLQCRLDLVQVVWSSLWDAGPSDRRQCRARQELIQMKQNRKSQADGCLSEHDIVPQQLLSALFRNYISEILNRIASKRLGGQTYNA